MSNNYTNDWLQAIESNQSPNINLFTLLKTRIAKLVNIKEPKYNWREKQISAMLYFIRKNEDVFVVVPTGYGKTDVAIVAAKFMWEVHHKKSIFIGLYKSLTSEQNEHLNSLHIPNFIDDGDHDSADWENEHWIIGCMTPEKFDACMTNDSKRNSLMQDVGLIVTDEVQNLADEGRGHRMENYIMICKSQFPDTRFVYLSATIGNPEDLAQWAHAKLI